MDLVERYIYAVVKHLPAKNRKDIENELRSLIMDDLDERTKGNNPTKEDLIEVLKELGAPSKMATNYYKEGSYVIGPRFYELYVLMLKIVMAAAAIGLIVGFIVESVEKGIMVLDLLHFAGQALSALFGTIGVLTLVFAISERVNADSEKTVADFDSAWNPMELPAVPKQYETVKTSELMIGLLFTVLLFIIFNFYPKTLGFYFAEKQEFISLIQLDILSKYMPFINILIGFSFLKLILLLTHGKYKAFTFVLEILSTLGLIGLGALMLSGPTIVDVSRLADFQLQDTLSKVVNGVYRSILVAMILVGIVELGRFGYRFVRSLGKLV